MWIANRSINWTWYINAEIAGDTATILVYDRLHNERHTAHPDCEGRTGRLIEDKNRIVRELMVEDKRYTVANPKPVFDYGRFE